MQQKCTLFPERLTKLREKECMSRQQLADILGVSRASLEYYEKGKRTPDIEVLYKLSEHFNVTADYLIGRTDKCGKSTDENAVCEYTGLSEQAVKELNIIKQLSEYGYIDDECDLNINLKNALSKENTAFLEAVKYNDKQYLHYLSELILDIDFCSIITEVSEYIKINKKIEMINKESENFEKLKKYTEKADFSLYKITKYMQKAVSSISVNSKSNEVQNGND